MSQDTEAPSETPSSHICDTLSTKIIKGSNELQATEKVGIKIERKDKSINEKEQWVFA